MNKQQKSQYILAAVALLTGLVFVCNDSRQGWLLLVMSLAYLGLGLRAGRTEPPPPQERWATGLLIFLGVLVLAVMVAILLGW